MLHHIAPLPEGFDPTCVIAPEVVLALDITRLARGVVHVPRATALWQDPFDNATRRLTLAVNRVTTASKETVTRRLVAARDVCDDLIALTHHAVAADAIDEPDARELLGSLRLMRNLLHGIGEPLTTSDSATYAERAAEITDEESPEDDDPARARGGGTYVEAGSSGAASDAADGSPLPAQHVTREPQLPAVAYPRPLPPSRPHGRKGKRRKARR